MITNGFTYIAVLVFLAASISSGIGFIITYAVLHSQLGKQAVD